MNALLIITPLLVAAVLGWFLLTVITKQSNPAPGSALHSDTDSAQVLAQTDVLRGGNHDSAQAWDGVDRLKTGDANGL